MNNADTAKRKVGGLLKLAAIQSLKRMIVVTKDEERVLEQDGFTIELIPLWKWLLETTD